MEEDRRFNEGHTGYEMYPRPYWFLGREHLGQDTGGE